MKHSIDKIKGKDFHRRKIFFCNSGDFSGLSISLISGQAISNEEFDFDAQPVYTTKVIPNFANVCQQYVEKKLALLLVRISSRMAMIFGFRLVRALSMGLLVGRITSLHV